MQDFFPEKKDLSAVFKPTRNPKIQMEEFILLEKKLVEQTILKESVCQKCTRSVKRFIGKVFVDHIPVDSIREMRLFCKFMTSKLQIHVH